MERRDRGLQELIEHYQILDDFVKNSVSDTVKKDLLNNLMRTMIPECSEEDAALFLDTEFHPNASEPEKSLRFSQIERQIADLYNGNFNSRDSKAYAERLQAHHEGATAIIKNNFTTEEFKKFFPPGVSTNVLLDPGFVLVALGSSSFWGRRIRNAYLPTTITVVGSRKSFGDGPIDSVGSLDKLQGKL